MGVNITHISRHLHSGHTRHIWRSFCISDKEPKEINSNGIKGEYKVMLSHNMYACNFTKYVQLLKAEWDVAFRESFSSYLYVLSNS